VALCPDLFWRQEPEVRLSDQSEAEWGRAFALYQGFGEAKGVSDLVAALDHLRAMPACNGVAGSIGWCLGGKLAYLMATRSDTDCNVGYYGVGIDKALDETDRITHPLMLHMPALDSFCPPEVQTQIRSALGANPNVTLHGYAENDHAFARVGGEHYDAAAATLANDRTTAFLAEHLAL
jgi:carboxymethylenebutenolidase